MGLLPEHILAPGNEVTYGVSCIDWCPLGQASTRMEHGPLCYFPIFVTMGIMNLVSRH